MAYILDNTEIRRPHEISEQSSTQVAVQRTLDGSINRDFFGNTKRTWELKYTNIKPSDYQIIRNIYDSYITTGNLKTWQITEGVYIVSQISVHLDFVDRGFSVRGSSYLSDASLLIYEA